MKRLTHAELAAAQERQDWPVLWEQALPLVKLVVGRMARSGAIRSEDADDDLLQEGMLIAGQAMRSWRALECAYSTHITRLVEFELTDYLAKKSNGGIGSEKQSPLVLSTDDTREDVHSTDEELDDDGTFNATLTYAGAVKPSGQYDGCGYAPRGLGDPAEEADRQQVEETVRAVIEAQLSAEDAALVRAVYGFDGPPVATEEYAERAGLSARTVRRRLLNIRNTLAKKLPNFGS